MEMTEQNNTTALPSKAGTIPIIALVRLESERCPAKCLRPFYNDLSITDIFAQKFSSRPDVYLAARDKPFEDIATKYNIEFLERDRSSVEGETLAEVYNFIESLPYEYICVVNVCTPLLKAETVDAAIQAFKNSDCYSLELIVETHDVLFDSTKRPVSTDAAIPNSKVRQALYYASNGLVIFSKERVVKTGKYFESYEPGDPLLLPSSLLESLDIDTEEQFEIARACYAYFSSEV